MKMAAREPRTSITMPMSGLTTAISKVSINQSDAIDTRRLNSVSAMSV